MKNKIGSLICSFRYAFSGVWHCIRRERNFRVHLSAAAWAFFLARWVGLNGTGFAVLLLTIANVLAMEMINTAVEALTDLASPVIHPVARIAKDVAAGAVLVSALVSVAVGFWLLWRPDRLLSLLLLLLTAPWAFAAFVSALGLSLWFIFGAGMKQGFTK